MIPRAALGLGLAGLIPFLWGTASAFDPRLAGLSVRIFGPDLWGVWMVQDYGVVILSFMSGVLWGFATRATSRPWVWYGLSVLPALWVFLGPRGETDSRLLALGAGYLGLLGLDFTFWRAGLTPGWWMRLRVLLTAVVLVCLAASAQAEEDRSVTVTLHARSGSVAPPYAWAWDVTFKGAKVTTRYCKAYAETEPGCASREDQLTEAQTEALLALTQTLAPAPENPNPPIGGGATWAEVNGIRLPAHPLPKDEARVTEALDALQSFIPPGALDDTASRAKAP